MRFDVITLAPEAFRSPMDFGVIGRAFRSGRAELHTHNPREHATDRYRKVDDLPYGGGAGMVLKPEPVFAAVEALPVLPPRRVLLMSPQGRPLRQDDLWRWAEQEHQLVIICGHYEGFDERIRHLADEEVSIGDFVLTGGELPAMVVIHGVVRLIPGTVGTPASLEEESHSGLLLEHPHYTRPATFRGMAVPEVLRSGDHAAVSRWRAGQREKRTRERRPDLHARWFARTNPGDHGPPSERGGAAGKLEGDSPGNSMPLRIGNGYDIHRLVPGRPLILGGVNLEHPDGLGLEGHSDADVLVHAVMDALLGALALGDIGEHFPPEDSRWKGADSLQLLKQVATMVRQAGWQIGNVDAVVVAERPRLRPHISAMRAAIADALHLSPDQVGVKATTNERLGPTGREEGIASHAVALLVQP